MTPEGELVSRSGRASDTRGNGEPAGVAEERDGGFRPVGGSCACGCRGGCSEEAPLEFAAAAAATPTGRIVVVFEKEDGEVIVVVFEGEEEGEEDEDEGAAT